MDYPPSHADLQQLKSDLGYTGKQIEGVGKLLGLRIAACASFDIPAILVFARAVPASAPDGSATMSIRAVPMVSLDILTSNKKGPAEARPRINLFIE